MITMKTIYLVINYLNKKDHMKHLFDIPNVGKVFIGSIDDITVEQIRDNIKDIRDKVKNIRYKANESKDVSNAYTFIKGVLDIQKSKGKSLDDYAKFMNDEAKTDTDCFCPTCIANMFSNLTDAEINELGADNCATVIRSVIDYIDVRTGISLNIIKDVECKCRDIAERHKTKSDCRCKSYDEMSREELIKELKKKK